jgi:CRISPR system Cascade subunit CasD
MKNYLIIRLQGVMQAWGGHTYEDYRPTNLFPTRSGLVGLLGSCLGLDRANLEGLRALSDSFVFAVRLDKGGHPTRVLTDFHTVMEARRVSGKAGENPIVSRREYLCDTSFTVALEFAEDAAFGMDRITEALKRPHFTPSLGRRSCPITRPLFDRVLKAEGLVDALGRVEPRAGVIYSETSEGSQNRLVVRDVPMFNGRRQFSPRPVYIHSQGGGNVPE